MVFATFETAVAAVTAEALEQIFTNGEELSVKDVHTALLEKVGVILFDAFVR